MATRLGNKETSSKTTEGPGGSSVKTTTTTYETNRSYETEGPTYRAGITPRNLIIQRSNYGPAQKSQYSVEKSSSFGMMSAPGAYANISGVGIANIKGHRVQEKKDMRDLNERFASYIERVRFLEAQNRKLADELDKLKGKWGKETTAIKAMYQAELDEARKLLDDAEREKARLQLRLTSIEEINEELRLKNNDLKIDVNELGEKLQKQNEQLSSYESEINLLQRRVESLENDREKDKKEIARLQEALNRARVDLDNETLAHIEAENRRQTLEEELEFLKQVHDQEMKELAALAYRDTTSENRDFWKNELASAIREIQTTYDEKMDGMRGELETYYNMKVQEFRTASAKGNMENVHSKEEVKRLRTQLTDARAKAGDCEGRMKALEDQLRNLRSDYEERIRNLEMENGELSEKVARTTAELECVLKEMQDLMDSKLGLELEIAAYRKLLEGEENKVGLRQIVDTWVSGGQVETTEDSNLKVSQVVKGEMSAKTTYQRSAKGPVSIHECAADGKYVCLENTGRRDEQLNQWKIKRVIDGASKDDYQFPNNMSIQPGSKIKVWANGTMPSNASANDLEASFKSWGIGANINTKLVSNGGEDRATHVQKTIYHS